MILVNVLMKFGLLDEIPSDQSRQFILLIMTGTDSLLSWG